MALMIWAFAPLLQEELIPLVLTLWKVTPFSWASLVLVLIHACEHPQTDRISTLALHSFSHPSLEQELMKVCSWCLCQSLLLDLMSLCAVSKQAQLQMICLEFTDSMEACSHKSLNISSLTQSCWSFLSFSAQQLAKDTQCSDGVAESLTLILIVLSDQASCIQSAPVWKSIHYSCCLRLADRKYARGEALHFTFWKIVLVGWLWLDLMDFWLEVKMIAEFEQLADVGLGLMAKLWVGIFVALKLAEPKAVTVF